MLIDSVHNPRGPGLARPTVLAVLAVGGCAPITRASADVPHPFDHEGVLEPALVRPRYAEQKAVAARLDQPSAAFHACVARGQVRADGSIELSIELWHPWRELADVGAYEATLVTDDGRRLAVAEIHGREVALSTSQVDVTKVITTQVPVMANGRVVGQREIQSLEGGTLEGDLWRGRAQLRFAGRDFIRREQRGLRLELRQSKQAFHFTWRFGAPAPSTPGPS